MSISSDDFRLQHSCEIRESLIMIEGNDGSFELLACGWLLNSGGGKRPFALVRSIGTDRVHLLIRSSGRDPGHIYNWHRAGPALLRNLANRIAYSPGGGMTPQATSASV